MSAAIPIVLSADDDEDAHLLLQRAFVKAGVKGRLLQVSNGQEAIDYIVGFGRFADRSAHPPPALLLLDLKMPIVTGFGVLEFLRSEPQRRTFQVVVFSSSNNPQDVKQAKALGCNSYLVKPGDFKGLTEMVQRIEKDFLWPRPPAPTLLKPFAEQEKVTSATAQQVLNPAESPEIFKMLVEQVKDYAIFLLDVEGKIRSWNEGAKRIKGYEAHEIIGKHFSIFYTRQDLDTEKPTFELRMVNDMGRYEEEGWRVRKDGTRFWANVVITPLRDPTGYLTGYAKVTRDLTARKLQEEHMQRLLESEERFRLLVDQVKDYAIFFLDARGIISSWNQGASRIKGYTPDEIIGRHFSTFYTAEDLADDKPTRELSIAIREGRYEEEGWRLRKDGTRFWASVVITALWDKRGNLSGFAKVTRDLTVRKREEEATRAKTEELEGFAHTLSHDLRAPIRSISSFSELLCEDTHLSPDEQRAYLHKINRAALSMDNLIRDILKLSEISIAPLSDEQVNVDHVIEEALALQESEIVAKHAIIDVRGPLPRLRVNRTLLLQIFSNLIANALKFAAPGESPRVEIFVIHHDFECEFHVKDAGPGIPPEMHEAIFKLFTRGPAGANAAGSGVGLTIVRRAAQRAGGRIHIESAPGQGSDFIVTLPCASSTPMHAQPSHAA